MKALTLHQPWASLIAWGEKQCETRSWKTPYRGLLAIHAGKHFPTREEMHHIGPHFNRVAANHMPRQDNPDKRVPLLPYSVVLCVVNLVAIYETEHLTSRVQLSEQELAFGNFAPGRYAWKLEVVEVFDTPIPAQGKQGLWDWQRP